MCAIEPPRERSGRENGILRTWGRCSRSRRGEAGGASLLCVRRRPCSDKCGLGKLYPHPSVCVSRVGTVSSGLSACPHYMSDPGSAVGSVEASFAPPVPSSHNNCLINVGGIDTKSRVPPTPVPLFSKKRLRLSRLAPFPRPLYERSGGLRGGGRICCGEKKNTKEVAK